MVALTYRGRQGSSDLDSDHILTALDQVRILDAPSFDHPGRAFAILLGGNDASMDLTKHGQGFRLLLQSFSG